MDDAVIEVLDHFIIADLDVGITLTHTNVFDLQISLQNPAGTILTLNMYNFDEYFEAENYTNTIFDDEAPLSIKEGEAPFTGRFRPLDVLSDFDGTDAYGLWHLRICDMWEWNIGTFNHLELIFTPEPSTATLLILGASLLTLFRPHRHR